MKKLVLSLIMGAMLATSVVTAFGETTTPKGTETGTTVVSDSSQIIYRPQTDDPRGW